MPDEWIDSILQLQDTVRMLQALFCREISQNTNPVYHEKQGPSERFHNEALTGFLNL